ncbi:MAG: hypothetical protein ACLFWG_10280 [Longimicrobiales bacterium]
MLAVAPISGGMILPAVIGAVPVISVTGVIGVLPLLWVGVVAFRLHRRGHLLQ